MKKSFLKKLSIEELGSLSIAFREHVLNSDVVEHSPNGVWIENTFGELIEYLVTVYRDFIFGNAYTDDYPMIQISHK